ncbi:MAG: hypothetical protein ACPGJV_12640 [Bacteriovoracaceae bacterium]
MKKEEVKRVSVLLREDQHQTLSDMGLNVSGLIRDLLDDYLSEHKVTIAVGEETKELYDLVISNTGSSDQELEKYLKQGLKSLVQDKIEMMKNLADRI